jgi:predicted hydrocarbon binding protein
LAVIEKAAPNEFEQAVKMDLSQGKIEGRRFPTRFFLFTPEEFEYLAQRIFERFDSATFLILELAGAEYGRKVAEIVRASAPAPNLIPDVFEKTIKAIGLGSPKNKVTGNPPSSVEIYLWHCAFCEPSKDKQKRRATSFGCHFLKAVFRGAFESLYDKKYEVKEPKCSFKGDDACVIVLTEKRNSSSATS